MQKRKLWKKFLKILLTRMPVLIFAGFTIISLIAGWAFDFRIILINVIFVIFLLLTLGIIGQIFLLSSDKIARQAKEELKREADGLRELNLDNLYSRLTEDKDPRTEKALQDLREIAREIKESAGNESQLDSQSAFEVLLKVEELFDKCVSRLEKSLKIWESSQKISDEQIRKKLLDLREDVISDVRKSINYLGGIFARIQALQFGQNSNKEDLLLIMKDLEEGLTIAEQVDEQVRRLESGGKQME